MNAADVVGYTFDADTYCVDCMERMLNGLSIRVTGEGDAPKPIFGDQVHSGDEPDYCAVCHELLAPYECQICGDEHGESAHGDPLVQRDQGLRTIVDAVAVYVLDGMTLCQDSGHDAEFQRLVGLYDDWSADMPDDERDEHAPEYLDDIDAILTDAGYLPVTDPYQGTWSVYAPVASQVSA